MAKELIYNDDGWSTYMRNPAPMVPEEIIRLSVGPIIATSVTIYQFCSLGGHAVNYNSGSLPRVGEMMGEIDTMHVWRMRETMRHLESLGTDALKVVADACHAHDIKCQFSLRMSDAHHTYKRSDGSYHFPELLSAWMDENPDVLQRPGGVLDYAKEQVRDYRKRQIAEILERPEVDGIDLDFTRFKPWFKDGEEQSGMPLMTALVRELSQMTRAAGRTFSARFEYDPGRIGRLSAYIWRFLGAVRPAGEGIACHNRGWAYHPDLWAMLCSPTRVHPPRRGA